MSESHNTLRRMVYRLRNDAADAQEHADAMNMHADTLEAQTLEASDEEAALFVAIVLKEVPELRNCATPDKDRN